MTRSIEGLCLARSLGRNVCFDEPALSELCCIDIAELDQTLQCTAGVPPSYLKCCIILGFVPGHPRLLVAIINPRMMRFQATFLSYSLMILMIVPGHGYHNVAVKVLAYDYDWTSVMYEDLLRVESVVTKGTLIQVLVYHEEDECSDHGVLEIRRSQITSLLGTSDTKPLRFATVEARHARVCFARQVILLQTRCIFILSVAGNVTKRGEYWSTEETMNTCGIKASIFEIDIYVESLIRMQKHSFGSKPSSWTYLTAFHPRPREAIEAGKRNHVLEDNVVLIVTVLAEDRRSVLQAVVYVNPTSTKDAVTLSAKRWHLKREAQDGQQVLAEVLRQQVGVTSSHDCQSQCCHTKTTFLSTYDRNQTSLETIKGDIWTITSSWNVK